MQRKPTAQYYKLGTREARDKMTAKQRMKMPTYNGLKRRRLKGKW